jgi:hypothetical protein
MMAMAVAVSAKVDGIVGDEKQGSVHSNQRGVIKGKKMHDYFRATAIYRKAKPTFSAQRYLPLYRLALGERSGER